MTCASSETSWHLVFASSIWFRINSLSIKFHANKFKFNKSKAPNSLMKKEKSFFTSTLREEGATWRNEGNGVIKSKLGESFAELNVIRKQAASGFMFPSIRFFPFTIALACDLLIRDQGYQMALSRRFFNLTSSLFTERHWRRRRHSIVGHSSQAAGNIFPCLLLIHSARKHVFTMERRKNAESLLILMSASDAAMFVYDDGVERSAVSFYGRVSVSSISRLLKQLRAFVVVELLKIPKRPIIPIKLPKSTATRAEISIWRLSWGIYIWICVFPSLSPALYRSRASLYPRFPPALNTIWINI